MKIRGNDKYYFHKFKKGKKSIGDATDVVFPNCSHKGKVSLEGSVLTCKCGARWQGAGVGKLYDELKDMI